MARVRKSLHFTDGYAVLVTYIRKKACFTEGEWDDTLRKRNEDGYVDI